RADRLRTGDEAANELKILGPVELEPARGVAHRASDPLHGIRSLAREDVWDAQRGCGPADGDVRAVPNEPRRADGSHEKRRVESRAEYLGAHVSASGVAQHRREDLDPVESGSVGGD